MTHRTAREFSKILDRLHLSMLPFLRSYFLKADADGHWKPTNYWSGERSHLSQKIAAYIKKSPTVIEYESPFEMLIYSKYECATDCRQNKKGALIVKYKQLNAF